MKVGIFSLNTPEFDLKKEFSKSIAQKSITVFRDRLD